jgi:hypothetical protein
MQDYPTPLQEPDRLISVEEVQRLLTASNAVYGKDFTDKEWSETTERLCALARLIWRISQRELREEHAKTVRTSLS